MGSFPPTPVKLVFSAVFFRGKFEIFAAFLTARKSFPFFPGCPTVFRFRPGPADGQTKRKKKVNNTYLNEFERSFPCVFLLIKEMKLISFFVTFNIDKFFYDSLRWKALGSCDFLMSRPEILLVLLLFRGFFFFVLVTYPLPVRTTFKFSLCPHPLAPEQYFSNLTFTSGCLRALSFNHFTFFSKCRVRLQTPLLISLI